MENVKDVSMKIWKGMQDQNVSLLEELIHAQAMFVHMGVTFNRDSELDVIHKKEIVYHDIEFQDSTLNQIESTYILLNKLKLTAIVNGTTVTNPFVVTEVYTAENELLKLISMSFTKIVY